MIFNFSGLAWRLATIKNGMRDAVQYRGEFLISIFGSALVPVFIQIILWSSVFKNSPDHQFAGMTHAELLAYTWTSLLFSQIRGGNHDFELSEMIRTGSLNNYLVRPVGVIEFVYIRGLGEKLAVSALCLALGLIACLFTPLSAAGLIMGMCMALVGNITHYQFGAMLSSLAFYWENAFAILMVKNMLVSLMSGELLPLSLFPEQYSWIWKSTPFYLYVFGPTQLALGKWGFQDWILHMGIGFIWMFIFWAGVKISWGFSIKRYQGIGG